MAEEVSLSVEETNELRIRLGLKPIVESKDKKDNTNAIEENESSTKNINRATGSNTVNSKEAKLRERLNKEIDRTHKSIHDRSSDAPLKSDNWLENISLSKKMMSNESKLEAKNELPEYVNDDLPIVQVSHDIRNFQNGKDIILTLKESNIDESDSDNVVLENEDIVMENKTRKNIDLRNLNKERRKKKLDLNISSKEVEDEEIAKKLNLKPIIVGGEFQLQQDDVDSKTMIAEKGKVKVVFDKEEEEDSDTGDFKKINIKRRVKKNNNLGNKRKKINVPNGIKKVNLLVDGPNFSDDDDDEGELLSIQPIKKARTAAKNDSIDDIALQIKKEKEERLARSEDLARFRRGTSGIVIDENTSFLSSLNSTLLSKKETLTNLEKHTNSNIFDNEDKETLGEMMDSKENGNAGEMVNAKENARGNSISNASNSVDFYSGLASTLRFLQDHHALPVSKKNGKELESNSSAAGNPMKIHTPLGGGQAKYSEKGLERVTDNESKEHPQDSDQYQRERLENYNPEITLTYNDEKGNKLTTREAYKRLSQKFHGTKSNKKKRLKFENRIAVRNKEERQREIEDQGYYFNDFIQDKL